MGIPFDEKTMTIIMGLGDPMAPGQHGPLEDHTTDSSAIDLIIEIKEMCCDYLMKWGKCDTQKQEPDPKPTEDFNTEEE